jgi:hypothetical protein
MNKSNIDVPVYINFFNRPDTLLRVFDAVRQAKPSKLFLSCDGPREGRKDDIENIQKCQEIVEHVDWECEVFQNYSDINLGCGMRMYSGISWAFEHVEYLIILEDDCVPSQDYFRLCEELLEKYKDDNRIHMINAMNHLGVYKDTPYSYFFGPGCCWGWATWKRAWVNMDFYLNFMMDVYSMRCVERKYPFYQNACREGQERIDKLKAGQKLTSWTFQSGMAMALQSQMAIIPKVNLITNIGLTVDSVHAANNIKKLDHKTRAYFNAETFPVEFPLKHPQYVIEDWNYYDLVQKKFKHTVFTKAESYIRRVLFAEKGDFSKLYSKILKRLKR